MFLFRKFVVWLELCDDLNIFRCQCASVQQYRTTGITLTTEAFCFGDRRDNIAIPRFFCSFPGEFGTAL